MIDVKNSVTMMGNTIMQKKYMWLFFRMPTSRIATRNMFFMIRNFALFIVESVA